jgi:hypothetical protein
LGHDGLHQNHVGVLERLPNGRHIEGVLADINPLRVRVRGGGDHGEGQQGRLKVRVWLRARLKSRKRVFEESERGIHR